MAAGSGAGQQRIHCPGCGATLGIGSAAPGSWLACPSCRSPVEVPRGLAGPKPRGAIAEPDAPAEEDRPLSTDRPLLLDEMKYKGWVHLDRVRPAVDWRVGLVLSMLAGFAQVTYQRLWLVLRSPWDVLIGWCFGFALVGSSFLIANWVRRRYFPRT